MFLKACSNIERGGRSWALVAVGGVVLVFVLDDCPDTIPLEGGRMLPKRGRNSVQSAMGRELVGMSGRLTKCVVNALTLYRHLPPCCRACVERLQSRSAPGEAFCVTV